MINYLIFFSFALILGMLFYILMALRSNQGSEKGGSELLQNKLAEVSSDLNKIENDLEYIEKIAREKYKMVKPGEKIFKVVGQ